MIIIIIIMYTSCVDGMSRGACSGAEVRHAHRPDHFKSACCGPVYTHEIEYKIILICYSINIYGKSGVYTMAITIGIP